MVHTMIRLPRPVTTIVLGIGLAVSIVSCSNSTSDGTTSDSSSADVEVQVNDQLVQAGTNPDPGSLDCDGALAARVGDSVRCTFTTEEQPVDAVVTASAVDGDRVDIEVVTEPQAIPKLVLANSVYDLVQQQGIILSDLTCDADLQPTVGETTTCSGFDGTTDQMLRVTVTTVEGGQVGYDLTTG